MANPMGGPWDLLIGQLGQPSASNSAARRANSGSNANAANR